MEKLFLSFIFISLFLIADEKNNAFSSQQKKIQELKPLPTVIVKMLEEAFPQCQNAKCPPCCLKIKKAIEEIYNKEVPKEMTEEQFIAKLKEVLKKAKDKSSK